MVMKEMNFPSFPTTGQPIIVLGHCKTTQHSRILTDAMFELQFKSMMQGATEGIDEFH